MEREVSVFLPFQIDRKEAVSEPGVTEFFVTNFVSVFFLEIYGLSSPT